MGAIVEALILYAVLFLSGSTGQSGGEIIAVTAGAELYRMFMYSIPALALIWYLLYRNAGFKWAALKPRIADLLAAAIALPGLIIIGFSIALLSPHFSSIPQGPRLSPPSGAATWLALAFSCIATGYLEESFFRFYLLSRREQMGLDQAKAVLVSTLLFSLCHLYEGPWGFLNAALSGTILALIFLRYRSLHGIALAHGLYNLFVYAMSARTIY